MMLSRPMGRNYIARRTSSPELKRLTRIVYIITLIRWNYELYTKECRFIEVDCHLAIGRLVGANYSLCKKKGKYIKMMEGFTELLCRLVKRDINQRHTGERHHCAAFYGVQGRPLV